ncbi:hypothetical protein BO70DRAFT_409387 [Aspergillus heteromorphus CBS 117.55]|uniref:Uncharacterized protein n=1 Tax=Aspergillus heteromorphus CBS 117.55 TaxID=1448321 RepID=A0A317VRN8_9EURO|nr:uncharacterized protein BO70DRAFT_409387 [Aspergillus heteromorphus CBS 117.55]PWY76986.1 hypothetical protein BO70DRAFT_409387 [Aspergillus heteromorphus CBS 117.55]
MLPMLTGLFFFFFFLFFFLFFFFLLLRLPYPILLMRHPLQKRWLLDLLLRNRQITTNPTNPGELTLAIWPDTPAPTQPSYIDHPKVWILDCITMMFSEYRICAFICSDSTENSSARFSSGTGGQIDPIQIDIWGLFNGLPRRIEDLKEESNRLDGIDESPLGPTGCEITSFDDAD